MKLTDLEKDVLIEFFKIKQIELEQFINSHDEIEVSSRDFSGMGFFTKFQRHPCLKVADDNQSYKWGRVGAKLNNERIEAGFLFHIETGYIEMLEGYTYGEEWPENILCYTVSEIQVWDINKGEWIK